MKPFNLKEHLENPHRKVVTRDGRPVRIICTNGQLFSSGPNNSTYPVIALVKKSSNNRDKNLNEELLFCYSIDGHRIIGTDDRNDLFFETVKVSGWINIYRATTFPGGVSTGAIHETKEEALLTRTGEGKDNYLDTIFIEWEE